MLLINFVIRKKNPLFFSIENVFNSIQNKLLNKGFDIQKIYLPRFTSGMIAILFNLLWLVRFKRGIFHITGDVHYSVFALPPKRTVLTIHDLVFLHQSSGLKRLIMEYLFLKWPIRYVAQVTTVSEASKREIVQITQCDAGRIRVIPNPISDHIRYTPRVFNKQQPVILFLGSTPNKNLLRVVEALTDITCTLEIVGQIDKTTQQLIIKKGLIWNCNVGLTNEGITEKYAQADILLFPSIYEGFGLPILEAQKAGRVVVTSNISPMTDVAGEGACFVNPLDSMSIRDGVLRVISNDVYRENLIKLGFYNSSHFSSEFIANQYLDIYQSL